MANFVCQLCHSHVFSRLVLFVGLFFSLFLNWLDSWVFLIYFLYCLLTSVNIWILLLTMCQCISGLSVILYEVLCCNLIRIVFRFIENTQ